MQPLISWEATEHSYTEKTNDWYWSVGIISITSAALAFIFGSFMFGIIIIVVAFAFVVHSSKKPKRVSIEINDRGIVIDNILFHFLDLDAFWIDAHKLPSKLLVRSHKLFMPMIVIHIEEVDPEEVRDILLNYISETELHEGLSQIILERLGF